MILFPQATHEYQSHDVKHSLIKCYEKNMSGKIFVYWVLTEKLHIILWYCASLLIKLKSDSTSVSTHKA